jgi:hypothetical protein
VSLVACLPCCICIPVIVQIEPLARHPSGRILPRLPASPIPTPPSLQSDEPCQRRPSSRQWQWSEYFQGPIWREWLQQSASPLGFHCRSMRAREQSKLAGWASSGSPGTKVVRFASLTIITMRVCCSVPTCLIVLIGNSGNCQVSVGRVGG